MMHLHHYTVFIRSLYIVIHHYQSNKVFHTSVNITNPFMSTAAARAPHQAVARVEAISLTIPPAALSNLFILGA